MRRALPLLASLALLVAPAAAQDDPFAEVEIEATDRYLRVERARLGRLPRDAGQ